MNVFYGCWLFNITLIVAFVAYVGFILYVLRKNIKNRIVLYAAPSLIMGFLVLVNGGVARFSQGDRQIDKVLLIAIFATIVSFVIITITVPIFKSMQNKQK